MEHLERLIIDMKESLEREMRSGFAQLNTRFDNQSGRMNRHAALLQTGSSWTGEMNAWIEKIDVSLDVQDRQIAELTERLEKLERRGGNGHTPAP